MAFETPKTSRQRFTSTAEGSIFTHAEPGSADLFNLSVEEIVTFLDEMSGSDHEDGDLFKSIAAQLQKLTVELISYISTNGSPGHNYLIKKFVKRLAATDTVISFNWDTLLDRALVNSGHWHPAWGYGPTLRKLFTYREHSTRKPPRKYIRLLKLHGSINWLAKAQKREITKTYSPGSRFTDVVMMPPKMVKREIRGEVPTESQSDPVRSNWAVNSMRFYPCLWKEAEHQLAHARRIVFIGYSFPPADYSVSNMLRRAIGRAKASTGAFPAIDIVDPNALELARRFTQSFKIDFFDGKKLSAENTLHLSLESYLAGARASG